MSMMCPIRNATREKNDIGYDADSGLDIACPVHTRVYLPLPGMVAYCEHGHTPWVPTDAHPYDTPNSCLIFLDAPIHGRDGQLYKYLWFTHLSALAQTIPDGHPAVHWPAGKLIGWSGIGRSVPHLHFGIVYDRAQTRTMPQREIADLIWPPDGA